MDRRRGNQLQQQQNVSRVTAANMPHATKSFPIEKHAALILDDFAKKILSAKSLLAKRGIITLSPNSSESGNTKIVNPMPFSEIINISHYIVEKSEFLFHNATISAFLLAHLQSTVTRFADALSQDFSSAIAKLFDLQPKIFPAHAIDFSLSCSVLQLSQPLAIISCEKKTHTIQSPLQHTKYTNITDNELNLQYIFEFLLSESSTQSFTFQVKQRNTKAPPAIAKQNLNQSNNLLLRFIRICPENGSLIQSFQVQHHITQKALKQSTNASAFMLEITCVNLYTNVFGETYFVVCSESEEYSLEELRLEYARKGLKISESEIMAVIIDVYDAIRYLHSEGLVATSFSLADIVFVKGRWRLKCLPFLQRLERCCLVQGYFELMPPELQKFVCAKEVCVEIPFDGEAVDMFCLGGIAIGLASVGQKLSREFERLVAILMHVEPKNRRRFEEVYNLIAALRVPKKSGITASKAVQVVSKQSEQMLHNALFALGSKGLAVETVVDRESEEKNCIAKAYVLQKFQDYPNAITYYSKAESIALKSQKQYNLIPIYNNIGQILLKNAKVEQALNYFEKALTYSEKVCKKLSPEYAKSLENIGTAYESLEKYQQAEKCFEEAISIKYEIAKSKGSQQEMGIAQTLQNIAIIQERLGKLLPSIGNYKKAIEVESVVLGPKHPSFASIFERIGVLFNQMASRQSDALEYWNRALELYSLTVPQPVESIERVRRLIARISSKK